VVIILNKNDQAVINKCEVRNAECEVKTKISSGKGSFERLKKDKQEKIMHALIDEFAGAGYNMASTNAAAKNAGIAKGSLFKYFGNKKHMFFHVADHVLTHYADYIRAMIPMLPRDMLERFRAFQEKTLEFMGSNTAVYRFLIMAMKDNAEELRKKWDPITADIFEQMLEGIDLSYLRIGVKDLMKVIKWFDFAIDAEITAEAMKNISIEELKKMYKKKMDLMYDVLENGIYK
jgi:TetR/AcrR family transcriptional regulator